MFPELGEQHLVADLQQLGGAAFVAVRFLERRLDLIRLTRSDASSRAGGSLSSRFGTTETRRLGFRRRERQVQVSRLDRFDSAMTAARCSSAARGHFLATGRPVRSIPRPARAPARVFRSRQKRSTKSAPEADSTWRLRSGGRDREDREAEETSAAPRSRRAAHDSSRPRSDVDLHRCRAATRSNRLLEGPQNLRLQRQRHSPIRLRNSVPRCAISNFRAFGPRERPFVPEQPVSAGSSRTAAQLIRRTARPPAGSARGANARTTLPVPPPFDEHVRRSPLPVAARRRASAATDPH